MPLPSKVRPDQQYGQLTVLSDPFTIEGRRRVQVRCSCGTVKEVFPHALQQGGTVSCGCKRIAAAKKGKHGKFGTRVYRIWTGMLDRCRNPNNKDRHNYLDRGITVCPSWYDFETFYADMGEPPAGMTLDREDNSKGYSRSNCRWRTLKEQARNRRGNIVFTYAGETKTLAEWVEKSTLSYRLVWQRVANAGWSFEAALGLPVVEDKPETFWKPLTERINNDDKPSSVE